MLRRFLFKLVLEDAIRREEKAYRFYEQAAEAALLPEAAALLNRLCAEELRHRVQLEQLQLLGELPEVQFAEPEETAAAAPAEGTLEEGPPRDETRESPGGGLTPALSERSDAGAILAVALRKELEAARYYDVLSRRGPLRSVRTVFRRLCREERRHVQWVRRWQADRQAPDKAG